MLLNMVESLLFTGAGAGVGVESRREKKTGAKNRLALQYCLIGIRSDIKEETPCWKTLLCSCYASSVSLYRQFE